MKDKRYDSSVDLRYGFFVRVRFVEETKINGVDHVVMQDQKGNKKTVTKRLFDKHAKIIGEESK